MTFCSVSPPPKMRLFYLLSVSLILLSSWAAAQTATPSNTPTPSVGIRKGPDPNETKGTPTKESAAEQRAKYEQTINALKLRIGVATDKVMAKIINQEKDLRMRMGYFQKPERLDPNSFGSQDEIKQWMGLTDQLQESRDLVAKLYGNASEDLETALIAEHLAPAIAEPIRKELINSFPWEEISKKNELFNTYVEDHRQLLTFLDQHWQAWNATKPYFSDQKLEAEYEKLCEQITSTGKQIEALYTKINF